LALARDNEEQLVGDVVGVEGEGALSGRHHMQGAAQTGQPDRRADTAQPGQEAVAVSVLGQRDIRDVHHGPVHHGPIHHRLVCHLASPI
jgi:hypothetical protein